MAKIKIFSLGGLNENGKNLYVVDVDNDIFVFDAGLKYADDMMLGVDYLIPNYDYLKENENRIKGIFITHGHDGQMGTLPDMLVDLKNVKIYGTSFTIDVIRHDLEIENMDTSCLNVIEPHRKLEFGNNSIFPISLTHAVPDTVGYVLYTEDGAIVYTGNYVFDPTMTGRYKTDIGKLAYVGKQGVLCLLGESLYADKSGFTSPKHRISRVVSEVLSKYEGRILFNVFQAQITRIQELLNEVMLTDRKVVIMGKTLENIILNGIDNHYIFFDKSRIESIHKNHDDNAIIIISDEREKPFSNISRIIKGFDKFIKINENDTVVFATTVYDGMEKSATRIFDSVAKLGANLVIVPKKYLHYHASSEDVMLMLNMMNPKYYIPVIGEYRHQVANYNLAIKFGIPKENVLLKLNGEVSTFVNGKYVDDGLKVKVDDILVDGKTVGDVGEVVLKDRELLSESGIVVVTATVDKKTKKLMAGPEILTRGFVYVKESNELLSTATKICNDVIRENTKPEYIDFNRTKIGIRDKLGKFLYQETECNPMILVVMQEV